MVFSSPASAADVFASPSLTNALMARLPSGVLPVSDWWLLGWPWVQFTLQGCPVQLAGVWLGHWVFTWGCWWPCSFFPVCFTQPPWGLSGILFSWCGYGWPASLFSMRWEMEGVTVSLSSPCRSPSLVELSLVNCSPLGKDYLVGDPDILLNSF